MDAKPPERPRIPVGAGGADLPRSKDVLLLVDFINPLEFEQAQSIAPSALAAAKMTARLKRRLAAQGVPTVYANDNYGAWQSDFADVLRRTLAGGGTGAAMARLLRPARGDLTILKPRHSAFHATPLDLLLAQMRAKRLIVCGIAAELCVQMTAADAFLRGYRVWAPADCTASESTPLREAALAWMRRALQCDTRPAEAVVVD